MAGHPHTTESKLKLSNSMKGKGHKPIPRSARGSKTAGENTGRKEAARPYSDEDGNVECGRRLNTRPEMLPRQL